MKEKTSPKAPVDVNAYSMETTLPHTLREAVNELTECKPLRSALGDKFVRLYSTVKQHEYNTFLNVVSAWEREHLLLNV